jgi:hypothetical protein
MGASSGYDIVQKEEYPDFKSAYGGLVADAIHFSGHNTYNGTISTTEGCREIDCPEGWEDWEGGARSDFINKLWDEQCEKWGPAVGFTTPSGNFIFAYWAAE